jgi:hypothetical protein
MNQINLVDSNNPNLDLLEEFKKLDKYNLLKVLVNNRVYQNKKKDIKEVLYDLMGMNSTKYKRTPYKKEIISFYNLNSNNIKNIDSDYLKQFGINNRVFTTARKLKPFMEYLKAYEDIGEGFLLHTKSRDEMANMEYNQIILVFLIRNTRQIVAYVADQKINLNIESKSGFKSIFHSGELYLTIPDYFYPGKFKPEKTSLHSASLSTFLKKDTNYFKELVGLEPDIYNSLYNNWDVSKITLHDFLEEIV